MPWTCYCKEHFNKLEDFQEHHRVCARYKIISRLTANPSSELTDLQARLADAERIAERLAKAMQNKLDSDYPFDPSADAAMRQALADYALFKAHDSVGKEQDEKNL